MGSLVPKAKNRSALNPAKFKPERKLEQVNPNGVFWIVPSGSRNVLAASLGIVHQGIESFKHMREMKRRKTDVIGVTVTDKDNPSITRHRSVLNAAEIGVGAEIIDRSKKNERQNKKPVTLYCGRNYFYSTNLRK